MFSKDHSWTFRIGNEKVKKQHDHLETSLFKSDFLKLILEALFWGKLNTNVLSEQQLILIQLQCVREVFNHDI